MSLGMVDIIIILMIIMGAIVGFKQGAIKTGTKFLGMFFIIAISFMLKDKLMVLMYENLPFFDFFGLIKGLDAINILFYQFVSFILIFAILMFVLRILLLFTGLIEWLLKLTVILSIPSKIIGIFVGMLEYYVYLFLALYILNLPIFGLTLVSESKLGTKILEDTPILSELIEDTVDAYSDIWQVIKNRGDLDSKKVNTYVLATLLDNDLITIESARKLVDSNYIVLEDNSILDKYTDDDFFESIGGCLLIGGCDKEEESVVEIHREKISDLGTKITVGNIKITINSVGANRCFYDKTCDDNLKLEVLLTIDTGLGIINTNIITNDKPRWIVDTTNYVFADIEDGCLVIGVSEYRGRWINNGN